MYVANTRTATYLGCMMNSRIINRKSRFTGPKIWVEIEASFVSSKRGLSIVHNEMSIMVNLPCLKAYSCIQYQRVLCWLIHMFWRNDTVLWDPPSPPAPPRVLCNLSSEDICAGSLWKTAVRQNVNHTQTKKNTTCAPQTCTGDPDLTYTSDPGAPPQAIYWKLRLLAH